MSIGENLGGEGTTSTSPNGCCLALGKVLGMALDPDRKSLDPLDNPGKDLGNTLEEEEGEEDSRLESYLLLPAAKPLLSP